MGIAPETWLTKSGGRFHSDSLPNLLCCYCSPPQRNGKRIATASNNAKMITAPTALPSCVAKLRATQMTPTTTETGITGHLLRQRTLRYSFMWSLSQKPFQSHVDRKSVV